MRTRDTWNADFLTLSPAYQIFDSLDLSLLSDQWADMRIMNQIAQQNQLNEFRCVPIYKKNCNLDANPETIFYPSKRAGQLLNYEQHIRTTSTIPTRLNNWHDLFNFLIWLRFPHLKRTLNQWQCQQMQDRVTQGRTPLENALTLFDENGLIIVSSDPLLLDLIRDHQWHTLFWHQRESLKDQLQCLVFGHSLHEKLLSPYIGMTGHAVLLVVAKDYFQLKGEDKITQIDQWLSESCPFVTTKDLQPFPILGMPGWHQDNAKERFYYNDNYFRPRRL